MLRISNNGIITLSRGDNCSMPLFINMGTDLEPIRYDLRKHPETIIYFSLMQPNQYFENGCLRKMYSSQGNWNINDNGDLVISFIPKDTMYLMPGKYFYEVKADLTGEGYINTVIQKTEFYIQ